MTPKALIAPARLAGTPLLRTQTDERLVDLVRAGNDAAFEAIVARYRSPLLRYCSRLLGDGRAEDAVQQTLLRAYDGLHSSSREMHLRPWLFRIAHNVTINALRERGSRYEELSEQIDGVERPDQAHEKSERLREVVAAVGSLPTRQRDAIVLRELEGRSYDEIATSLGVSGGAVRQLLNRARTNLRAGVTALTPAGLLTRFPWAHGWGEESSARVAELCGGAAAGTLVAKVCTTALLTGAIVGGVATAPQGGDERGSADAAPIERPASDRAAEAPAQAGRAVARRSGTAGPADDEGRSGRRRGRGSGPGREGSEREHRGSRSGPGGGDENRGDDGGGETEDSDSEDRSGPSGSESEDSSGSGDSGDDSPDIERSGSGSSGSDSPGSLSSGSGTSGSGLDSSESESEDEDSGSSGSGD